MAAEYIFDRGYFGRWNTPMWAGETRAFKLIRLLRKQGVRGIKYTEGPVRGVSFMELHRLWGTYYEPDYLNRTFCYKDFQETRTAPIHFKVAF